MQETHSGCRTASVFPPKVRHNSRVIVRLWTIYHYNIDWQHYNKISTGMCNWRTVARCCKERSETLTIQSILNSETIILFLNKLYQSQNNLHLKQSILQTAETIWCLASYFSDFISKSKYHYYHILFLFSLWHIIRVVFA